MARWAKSDSRINTSPDWADLVNQNPLAACIYHMMWTACDEWGLLPGDLRRFKAEVCPLIDVSIRQLRSILRFLARKGHIILYERDGIEAIYLPSWHKYNKMRWQRLPEPRFPLPEQWVIPPRLREYMARHPDDRVTAMVRRAVAKISTNNDGRDPVATLAESQKTTTRYQEQPANTGRGPGSGAGSGTGTGAGEPGGGPRTTGCYITSGEPPAPDDSSPPTAQGPGKHTLEQPARKARRLMLAEPDPAAAAPGAPDVPPDRTPSSALEQELAFVLDELLLPLFSKHPDWHNGKRMRWRKDIAYAVENGQCTIEEVRAWLTSPETRPDIGDMDVPRSWLRRMFARARSPGRARDAPGPKPPEPAGKHRSGRVEF